MSESMARHRLIGKGASPITADDLSTIMTPLVGMLSKNDHK